jgi:hypothetical protein
MNGFRRKRVDDDGWGMIDEDQSPTIEKTPIDLWGTAVEQEDIVKPTGGYQVKANEQSKEKKGPAQSGAKITKKLSIGMQRKHSGWSMDEKPRMPRRQDQQEDDDDEYSPRPLGSSLSRRQGAGVDPRVWKALVVSFAFGGLFLLLRMAFKILSCALRLNT